MGKWKQPHRRWLDDDYFGDDENFETKIIDGKPCRILKDGGVFRTSLMMLDGADEILRNTAIDAAKQRGSKRGFTMADARRFGLEDGSQMHRPGWRFNTDATAAEKIALAHAVHDCEDEAAYRGGKADAVVPRTSASDGVRDERQAAYLDYERELSLAYLLPQQNEHTGAGSRGARETGRREGDRCLVQGRWGTLVDDGGGELICVPDDAGGTRDAATIQRDHAQTMRDEYARYEAELSEAWRGQK